MKKGSIFKSIYTDNIESVKYDNFFATFFQQKIKSQFELRSIFVKGKNWTMAINNPNENVNYRRNYDNLRYSPYLLPENIKNKVLKLMKLLHLDYGEVDFIVDKNDYYYFLEINPFGQFGMVSYSCNYFIEKEIAKLL